MRSAGIALCLLAVLAGCSSVAGPAAEPTASPTPTESCSLPSTTRVTTTSPTPTDSGTGQVSGGVAIDSAYEGRLSVVVYTEAGNEPVFARRYENASAIRLGDEMVDWRDYRVSIRVDCETMWDRPVSSYESYRLYVAENGTVRVRSKAEA